MLWGLMDIMHVKSLALCPPHGKSCRIRCCVLTIMHGMMDSRSIIQATPSKKLMMHAHKRVQLKLEIGMRPADCIDVNSLVVMFIIPEACKNVTNWGNWASCTEGPLRLTF